MSFTIDGGGPRVAASGGNTLPFSRAEINQTDQVLVHFTVATSNKMERLEIAQALSEALRPVRVNGHAIVALLTDQDVTMSAIDMKLLAAHMLPAIKQALGIP